MGDMMSDRSGYDWFCSLYKRYNCNAYVICESVDYLVCRYESPKQDHLLS
jgi:hypothetical protein